MRAQALVTLLQPTQVSTRIRSDGLLETERHIPGAAMRGALAAAWIAHNGVPSSNCSRREEFVELFEGGVRFSPLYAGNPPVSLSVFGHKYAVGTECEVSEIDAAQTDDLLSPDHCPSCHQRMEPVRGLRASDRPPVRTRTSVVVHESGVAIEGGLFSRVSIDRRRASRRDSEDAVPTILRGDLICDDVGSVERLAEFTPVRIGGRRTTHGLSTVTVGDPLPDITPEIRSDGRLVLRLISPAVFVDREGRPAPGPLNDDLSEALGTSAIVDRAWYRWETVGGWHVASGLPKPTEVAASAGSTYVVRFESPPEPRRLAALIMAGVGLRRHEGFGHLGGPSELSRSPREDALEAERRKAERDQRQQEVRQQTDRFASLRRFPSLVPLVRDAVLHPEKASYALDAAHGADDPYKLIPRQVHALLELAPELALEVLDLLEAGS